MSQKGFTIVELLIVIVVIAILAAITIVPIVAFSHVHMMHQFEAIFVILQITSRCIKQTMVSIRMTLPAMRMQTMRVMMHQFPFVPH